MDRNKKRVTYITGANTTLSAYGLNENKKKKKKNLDKIRYMFAVTALAAMIAIVLGYALRGDHQGLRVGILEPVSGYEVHVVHDDVCVGDPVRIVVVVDDCDLVLSEVRLGPFHGELAQSLEVQRVAGVR